MELVELRSARVRAAPSAVSSAEAGSDSIPFRKIDRDAKIDGIIEYCDGR